MSARKPVDIDVYDSTTWLMGSYDEEVSKIRTGTGTNCEAPDPRLSIRSAVEQDYNLFSLCAEDCHGLRQLYLQLITGG